MFILYALGYDIIISCELIVLLYVLCSVNTSTIFASINSIPVLTGINFKKWREHITIVFDCMDLDLAIQTKPPTALTDSNTTKEMTYYEKWEHSNRISLIIMNHDILGNYKGLNS